MKKVITKAVRKFRERRFDIENPLGKKILDKKLSYLSKGALHSIQQVIKKLESDKIEGKFVEMGCALGGSSIQIGKTKSRDRVFEVYDVFGMIPEPSKKDSEDIHERYDVIVNGESSGIDGNKYYGYEEDLLSKVKSNLTQFGLLQDDNIFFVKGLYQDTLDIDSAIAFAHIDCDWYDSVMTCLTRIEPYLSVGGVMIIDDYYSWSGCKDAVDDYYTPEKRSKVSFVKRAGKLVITKTN